MQKRNIFILITLLLLPLLGHTQAWKWANSLGSANNSTTVKSIKRYNGTDVLVCGSFAAPSLGLGSQTLTNAGQDDGYVAIADDDGQYNWAGSFGGSNQDFVVDAAAAPNGDFAVAGNFKSITMSIGGTNLSNSGETDAFVAKYNADMTLAWAKKIGSADIDEVSSVVMDADGNTYVSGHVLDKFTLVTLYVFLRKMDAAGNQVWERKGTIQGGILQTTALTLDAAQAVYLGGSVYGTAVFGNSGLSSSDTSAAAYIVKYNPSGLLLATHVNTAIEKYNGLQVQGSNIYACAEKMNYGIGWGWPLADSKTHVLKLDLNFNTLWHKTAGGENPWQSLDIARSLSVDESGNVYVTGSFFSDTLQFAGQALPNPFNSEYYYPQIFVFKYSSNGNELWAKSLGGIHSDEATSIFAFDDDKFYLGGNFESDPASFGAFNLRNTGTLDSIYVHLRPARYGRQPMGFLTLFDKEVSDTTPEPTFEEIAIFPNPTNGFITVRLKAPTDSPLVFQLHAADGRLLRQKEYVQPVSELEEDLTGLPPGSYFVNLWTEQGVFVGRVLKQ